ncbi:MAG: CAP domain-containing protein [Clostridiaceae bacterium]|nr:CAP domain-containing protein [Clostridiaceae bacterium]
MIRKENLLAFSVLLITVLLSVSGCTFTFHSERTLDSVLTIPSETTDETTTTEPSTLPSTTSTTEPQPGSETTADPSKTDETFVITESGSSETEPRQTEESDPTIPPSVTPSTISTEEETTPSADIIEETTDDPDITPTTTILSYRVRFFVQGKEIHSVHVTPGSSVLPPPAPKIPGRIFVAWTNESRLRRVTQDLDVQAIYNYVQIKVTVRTQVTTNVTASYEEHKFLIDYGSDFLPPKELETPPFGMVFTAWRGNQSELISDTVITAEYKQDPKAIAIVLSSGRKVLGYPDPDLAGDFLALLNYRRLERGLDTLETAETQRQAALARALELSVNFSHIRPDGDSYWTAYNLKTTSSMSENILYGTDDPEAAFEYWNNLTGHRENMFGSYDSTIVAVVRGEKYHYWVQGFFSD